MRALALILALGLGAPASAEGTVAPPEAGGDPLPDDAFFNRVTCAVHQGGDCPDMPLRYERLGQPVRVALRRIDPAFIGGKTLRAHAAVTRAVQQINGAGATLRIAEVEGDAPAEIEIYLLDLPKDATIASTGHEIADGEKMSGSRSFIRPDEDGTGIAGGVIVLSSALPIQWYEAALLEEITRSLGFTGELDRALYHETSVFAEGGSPLKTLGEQDIMALQRLYARKPIR